MENIKNKYNLLLTTLPSNDSELLTKIEKRFLLYIPTNESHMKPFENEMKNTFILIRTLMNRLYNIIKA